MSKMATVRLLVRNVLTRWRPNSLTRVPVAQPWTQYSKRVLSTTSVLHRPDKVTHTGQSWSEDDYRNVRFIDREKQINEKFAIDLLAEEPVVAVKGNHTWCDGGHAELGHPKVYINLDKPEINVCGYCGKRFVSEEHKNLFPEEKFSSPDL